MASIENDLSQAIITLGGKGTRLSEISHGTPKPLLKINGKSTLERSIKILVGQGISRFIWLLNFKYNKFKEEADYFVEKYKINIILHKEDKPRGEAGGLLEIKDLLDDNFLFLNGDIIFDINLNKFKGFHIRNNSDLSFITHITNHPEDSDCVSESPSFRLNRYKLKESKESDNNFYLGNAGISLIQKKIIDFISKSNIKKNKELSLFKDFIVFAHLNKFLVFSYNTSEYLKDMGTPKRIDEVKKDLEVGLIESRSYRKKQRVLFLDRDNTLIDCLPGKYIITEDFKLLEENIIKISKIANNFNFVILVSNQPQISMGLTTHQKVIDINSKLILNCQKLGLNISCAYICPHHPHSGFENEVIELKTDCFCRKPQPGMLINASFNRNIDIKNSLLIGDSWRDRQAAKNINMEFISVFDLDSSSYF